MYSLGRFQRAIGSVALIERWTTEFHSSRQVCRRVLWRVLPCSLFSFGVLTSSLIANL